MRREGIPTLPIAAATIAAAPSLTFDQLRRLLAEIEYQRLTSLDAIEAELEAGRPGTRLVRRALKAHRPELAATFSVLEERFLALVETNGLDLPEVNATVEGLMVDAVWPAPRLIVELDGHRAHAAPAAIERDRGREMVLRAAGYRVLRYTWSQIVHSPQAVVADLQQAFWNC